MQHEPAAAFEWLRVSVWPHVSNLIFLYKCMRNPSWLTSKMRHESTSLNTCQRDFKGVVRLIRAKKSIVSIIFFKDTINIYLFV